MKKWAAMTEKMGGIVWAMQKAEYIPRHDDYDIRIECPDSSASSSVIGYK